MITVVIAEDHQALIDGVKSFFTRSRTIKIIGSAINGKELVDLVEELKPDVVITDIRMPIMNGIEATKKIKRRFNSVNVLAFTMFDDENAITQMLEAGAIGYILKNSGLNIMIKAIRTVAKGKKYFDPNVLNKIEKKKDKKKPKEKGILSKREKEILNFIAKGKKSLEISEILNIAKLTVDTHRKNIKRKLRLKANDDLKKFAIDQKYNF